MAAMRMKTCPVAVAIVTKGPPLNHLRSALSIIPKPPPFGLKLRLPTRALRRETVDLLHHDPDESMEFFISAVEAVCVVSSAAFSVAFALLPGCRRLAAAAMLAMAAATGIGAWERRRRSSRRSSNEEEGSLIMTLKKNCDGLARHVEKLGNRVRVTRRALNAEMAELAHHNADATRALSAQHHALQNDLADMHNLLVAMQEQQQKQVHLILAIANTATSAQQSTQPIV